jgi:hypothetical protein
MVFLALLLPVWALGVVHGERIARAIGVLPPFFGDDLARFDRLRPRLATAPSATLMLDRARGLPAAERFFAAQYSLAPTVLSWATGVDEAFGSHGKGEPGLVLVAFDDRAQHAAALVALEGRARRQGLTYEAEPLDEVLTLVRLGRE